MWYMKQPITEVSLSAADAAALIRKNLKAAFPGTKFSVRSARFSQGSSIDVTYTDGPVKTAVEAIAEAYGSRGYDGMNEVTTFSTSDHATLTPEGIVSYRCRSFVHVKRELSVDAMRAIGFDLTRLSWDDNQPKPYQYNGIDLRDLTIVAVLMAAEACA